MLGLEALKRTFFRIDDYFTVEHGMQFRAYLEKQEDAGGKLLLTNIEDLIAMDSLPEDERRKALDGIVMKFEKHVESFYRIKGIEPTDEYLKALRERSDRIERDAGLRFHRPVRSYVDSALKEAPRDFWDDAP